MANVLIQWNAGKYGTWTMPPGGYLDSFYGDFSYNVPALIFMKPTTDKRCMINNNLVNFHWDRIKRRNENDDNVRTDLIADEFSMNSFETWYFTWLYV